MPYHLKDSLKEVYLKVRKILLFPFLLLRRTKTPKVGEIKKILFLRHDRIGDMVLSTAVYKALKRKYPLARLTVLASERNHEIIQNNPNVDEILIYKGFGWFIKEIRTRNFDLAIDPFLTYEFKQAFMTYLSGAKYRIGFEEAGREIFFNVRGPITLPEKNMVEHLLDLSEKIGAKREGCEPEIFLTEEEKKWASSFLSERGLTAAIKVAIHPGAFYPSQRWPAVRFGKIAKRIIKECRVKVFLFGDKGEELLLKTVQDITGDRTEIFRGLRLRQFMALLNHCNLLICNNSGPLHIASALRIPTVSIMGPTVTPSWLPWGKNHIVIRKELPCSPCNKAECEDHSCMGLITVEEVMDAVKSQVGRIKLTQVERGKS
ncbi:MAG: glycosyltransferase family 9 protein [Nitrospirota bacterium]|nr:glycosyltransferase family 9 protein [Nitrospirota bacterium]